MLSNLIRWNGKRKGSKASEDRDRSRQQTTTSSSTPPLSPMVFSIKEDSASLLDVRTPLSVDISTLYSNESRFHQSLLRSRSCSPGLSLDRVQRTNGAQLTRSDISSTPTSRASRDTSPRTAARKKSIPAPILIPDVELCGPTIQIGRSPPSTAIPAPETTQPIAKNASRYPPSPSQSDNCSSISGTALAHAAIASTFVLTSSERRASRHRSGTVRQDSATLPRRESCLTYNSARSSPIPPVPPVPATVAGRPPSPVHLLSIQSGVSTESDYPMSDGTTSPDMATDSKISVRISRAPEAPCKTVSPSSDAPPAVTNVALEGQTSLSPGCTRVLKDNIFDGPRTAVDIPLPINIQENMPNSSSEGSLGLNSEGHSLDDFDFVPPEHLVAVGSPGSESSASYTSPLPRGRSDAKRRRRFGGSNFVRSGFKDQPEVIASHPNPSMPSATGSEHDYGELFNCELTVSPGSSSSSHFLSSGSAGYQTFPETPMGFSPLWSPLYALLAKSDNQVLRRRPPTPAGLGPRMLYPAMKTTRLQAQGGILRRSRSPLLPKQEAPSPRQASSLSASVHLTDKQDVPENPGQSLSTVEVESKVVKPAVRPHSLSHTSTSSPCSPEEEALQASARHPSPTLPSIPVDDGGTLPNALPDPSITDSAPIPLPESIDGSPADSPVLVSNAMAIMSSTSPVRSPLPSSTTIVSQPNSSKSLLSDSPASYGELFQPSPPPAASDMPLSLFLPPISMAPSPPASDESISASFFPPPPYHTVVSERTAYHASSPATSPSSDHGCQRRRHTSDSFRTSGTVGRARPPLPIGPRKPSGSGQVFGSYSSVSSMSSSDPGSSPGSPWDKLQSAASQPLPKFQIPPPKWRGLTLEAARWTFSSGQLQEVVSRALAQSSEGSSIRLLRIEVLEGEIADEMHRLELQHTDVKSQYRALVRKRWALMGTLVSQMEGRETRKAADTTEALVEVMSTLDQLADKMHDIVLEMSQLRSLHDVHNASALALAVRKINGVFVRQTAEKERLQEHVEALKAERDEAWKHAEGLAKEYDTLSDRMSDATARVGGDSKIDEHGINTRLTRIMAVRKSANRLSLASLRSRSRHRPSRRSSTATRPSSLAADDVVPPLPRLSVTMPDGPTYTGSVYSCFPTGTTEALALAEAQREVYEMLGMNPPSQVSSPVNRRRLSMPDNLWRPPRRRPRPVSESLLARGRPVRPERARATKSVMFESINNRLAPPVL